MNCPNGLECASSLKIDHATQVQGILNIKKIPKYIIDLKVMAILLNGWILSVGWDARRRVCAWHIWGSVSLGHSLRLNAEFVARAWEILGSFVVGGQNDFKVCHSFFWCALYVYNKRKIEKCPKSIQLWLCFKYCTEKKTLGHVQPFFGGYV